MRRRVDEPWSLLLGLRFGDLSPFDGDVADHGVREVLEEARRRTGSCLLGARTLAVDRTAAKERLALRRLALVGQIVELIAFVSLPGEVEWVRWRAFGIGSAPGVTPGVWHDLAGVAGEE